MKKTLVSAGIVLTLINSFTFPVKAENNELFRETLRIRYTESGIPYNEDTLKASENMAQAVCKALNRGVSIGQILGVTVTTRSRATGEYTELNSTQDAIIIGHGIYYFCPQYSNVLD